MDNFFMDNSQPNQIDHFIFLIEINQTYFNGVIKLRVLQT